MKKLLILILAAAALTMASAADKVKHRATVTETMDAGGYTYMKVSEGQNAYWVAVAATPVKVGQSVTYAEEMWMPNFKSRALNRTFDKILFATMVYAPGLQPQTPAVKPSNAPKHVMKKAENGYSVAEVFAKRHALNGKQVRVRGKVTKVSKQIMKRNWIHIEDGTGDAASDDLVFTTEAVPGVQPGDTVVATGTAATDKDFGYGYFYPVIVEKSSFVKEK